jgi:hypothetical protein
MIHKGNSSHASPVFGCQPAFVLPPQCRHRTIRPSDLADGKASIHVKATDVPCRRKEQEKVRAQGRLDGKRKAAARLPTAGGKQASAAEATPPDTITCYSGNWAYGVN